LLQDLLLSRIRDDGPLTAASFMESALYHPELGYYTRSPYPPSATRTDDDDATRLLGELLARQLVAFARALRPSGSPFTVIDAGAGDGRLSHALLRALRNLDADLCSSTHLHLIERSDSARHAQRTTLTAWTDRAIEGEALPDEFEGVVIARHVLSAFPAHLVTAQQGGLREIYVDGRDGRLMTVDGPVSSPLLHAHVRDGRGTLPDDLQVAVSPAALDWVADAARRLRRGYILVIDTENGMHMHDRDRSHWSEAPGERPIAADVVFAAVQRAGGSEGCVTARFTDQTSFLVSLAGHLASGFGDAERHAFTALTRPGGPGSTTRVLMLVKNVDTRTGSAS
jgi:SAM-dependent MidA family methyltransferase